MSLANLVGFGSFKWVQVAHDMYERRLSQEFTDPSCTMDWKFEYTDPKKGVVVVQKPNHGLSHTLRSAAAYVWVVADGYNQSKKQVIISQGDVEDIQLALVFYVVGRENDAGSKEDPYLKFRRKSAEIFGQYVGENIPSFSQAKIHFYQTVLTDTCDPSDPRYVVTRLSHNSDLLRCVSKEVYEQNILVQVGNVVGNAYTQLIYNLVKNCLQFTGDRIGSTQGYNPPLFVRCSTNVLFCLKQIQRVLQVVHSPHLDILCELTDHEQIRKNSRLMRVLNSKAQLLLSASRQNELPDQRFYRLAKRVVVEGTVSTTAMSLILKNSLKTPFYFQMIDRNLGLDLVKKIPISAFQAEIEEDPYNAALYFNLARALPQGGNVSLKGPLEGHTMTIPQLLQKAVELDSNFYLAYLHLALSLPLNGSIEIHGKSMTQQQVYLRVIELDPQNFLAHHNLAVCLQNDASVVLPGGTTLTKQQLYVRALQLNPKSGLAYYNLGSILPLDGGVFVGSRYMTKQQLLLHAIDMNPQHSYAHLALSYTLAEGTAITLLNGTTLYKQQLALKASELITK